MGHIFLYGPPGVGKTTVGKKLAHNLNVPFVDLDREIEKSANQSVAQIMETQGESGFRDLEALTLRKCVNEKDGVVALGGGALLMAENRSLAESRGKVVLLTADLNTLITRLQHENGKRPLLAGDLKSDLEMLLEKRRAHYASFPVQIAANEKSIKQVAYQIQVVLGRYHLSAMGKYDVAVDGVNEVVNHPLKRPILVTDENVARFHSKHVLDILRSSGLDPKLLVIPAGESYKILDTIDSLWHGFLDAGLDRNGVVIALGGGVVGDMAGFAASTFMRGIDWICLPTTLLSMVDASLGGKTGFDLPEGKNLIGSFHPPKLVLSDVRMLETLPDEEFVSGLAEVVKHGIISDPDLFLLCGRGLDWIKDHVLEIVKRSIAVKIQVIEADPYERGFRAALNLGHTIGHALELASHYQLRHGEAVAIGMVAEAKLAERLMIADKGLSDEIAGTLSGLGLPVQIPKELSHKEIVRAIHVDKKKNGEAVRFALPVEIGKVELMDVSDLNNIMEAV